MPTFKTTVLKDDTVNATGLRIPADIVTALGKGKKPPVKVTINGYTYRNTIASYGNEVYMLSLSAENRKSAGVNAGDEIEVTLELDTEPRTVEVPADLAAALAAKPGATEAFDVLAPSKRKEFVRQVNEAKAQETRDRRIANIVEKMGNP